MVLQWQFGHVNFLLAHVDEKAVRPLCFHAKLPGELAFVPYPWASSSTCSHQESIWRSRVYQVVPGQ